MIASASTLPANGGYVAAAYIVFFAIVLIYVAIMAVRLSRTERRVAELRAAERDERSPATAGIGDAGEHPQDPRQERTPA